MDTLESIGTKRKFQEKKLTANAENGSLEVKILKKDLRTGVSNPSFIFNQHIHTDISSTSRSREYDSPPKPRPNRKHIPAFFKRTLPSSDKSHSDSRTFNSYSNTSISSSTENLEFTNLTRHSHDSFPSQMSHIQLSSIRNPHLNPLFVRSDSESRSYISSEENSSLHQLAESSLNTLPMLNGDQGQQYNTTANTESSRSSSYRFNPMNALQNAVRLAESPKTSNEQNDPELGSPPTATPVLQGQNSLFGGGISSAIELGPPPTSAPSLNFQHSLMGGGIESQPIIAKVNTINFNWSRNHSHLKLTHETVTSSGIVHSETIDVSSPSGQVHHQNENKFAIEEPINAEIEEPTNVVAIEVPTNDDAIEVPTNEIAIEERPDLVE